MLHPGLICHATGWTCTCSMPRPAPSRSPPPPMPTGSAAWSARPPPTGSRCGSDRSMNRARSSMTSSSWPAGRSHRRRPEGQGPGPLASKTDHRRLGPPRAVPPRPGPEIWLPTPRSGPAGTRPMAMSPGPPPHRAPAPPPATLLAFGRPVRSAPRRRRPPAPGQTGLPQPPEPGRGLALIDDLRPAPRLRTRPSAPRRRPPLCAAALTPQDRLGACSPSPPSWRHRPVPVTQEALRRHRPVPRVYQSIGPRPARPAGQARPAVPALGADRSGHPRRPHPRDRDHDQRTKQRLGRQRGPRVARVEVARKLTEAIWSMLTRQQPFAPARPLPALWSPDDPRLNWTSRSLPVDLLLPIQEAIQS